MRAGPHFHGPNGPLLQDCGHVLNRRDAHAAPQAALLRYLYICRSAGMAAYAYDSRGRSI